MAIQLRRGTQRQRLASEEVLEAGQPYMDTDTGYLFIGDGITQLKSLSRVIRPKAKKPPVVSIGFGGNPANLSVLKSTSGSLSQGTAEDIYRMRQGDVIRVDCAMGIGTHYPLTLVYILSAVQDGAPVMAEEQDSSGLSSSTYWFWGHIYGGLWGFLEVAFTGAPESEDLVISDISWQAQTGSDCRYLITDQGYTESQEVHGLLKTAGIDCSSLISAESVIGNTVGVGSSTSYKTVHPLYKHEVTAYSQDSSDQVVARVFFYSASPDASTAGAAYYYGIDATGTNMFSNKPLSNADDSDYSPFCSVSGYIQIGTSIFSPSLATYPIIGFASDYANAKAGFWYLDSSQCIRSKILTKITWSWIDKVSQVK